MHYTTEQPRLRLRAAPVVVRFGIVILSGVVSWRLFVAVDGGLGTLLAALTGAIALYGMYNLGPSLRGVWVRDMDAVTRTNFAVSWADVPEFIRRFFSEDHEWITQHTQKPDSAETLERR